MCRDGWTPLSTTKFNWSVNIKSIKVEEFGKMWVGSEISCCRSWVGASESICEPSFDVMSLFHHDLDLALKSPSITTKDDLNYWIWYRSFSKSSKKLANSLPVWLGEWYKTAI